MYHPTQITASVNEESSQRNSVLQEVSTPQLDLSSEGEIVPGYRPRTKQKPVLSLENSIAKSYPLWKRSIDIIGALLGIIVLLPFFIIIAFVVKLTSRGAVFYSQERIGYQGRHLKCSSFAQ